MVIIDFLVGTLLGALCGMGVGGAGLLVIYLTVFRNTDQLYARQINLSFFIFAAASALSLHLKKRIIDYKKVLIIISAGLPSSYLGSIAAMSASPEVVRKAFGAMLLFAGCSVLLKRKNRGC